MDGAVLGEPEPGEVFPAGPGDAPVAGPDETLETGGQPLLRVEDDPLQGIPIEFVPAVEEEAEENE